MSYLGTTEIAGCVGGEGTWVDAEGSVLSKRKRGNGEIGQSVWLGNGAWNRLYAAFAAEFEANAIDIGHIMLFILHLSEQAQLA